MKRLITLIITCLTAIMLFFISCDLFDSGVGENSIYGKARKVAPEFPATRSWDVSRTWTSGDIFYELFNALQEFESPRDEGVIDRSNLYKMLYDTSTLWASLKNRGWAIPAQTLIPPFNFGNNFVYTYASNLTLEERAVAYSGGDEAMISWIWREGSSKREIGVLEMTTIGGNPDTILLDFIFCVDYNAADPATDYNMRSYLNGNITTHEFEYKSIRGSATDEGINMVGKGISKGTGNYFLFKIRAGSTSQVYYVVLPSEANQATLQAMTINDAYTDPNTLPATVAAYKDYVVNTPFFTFAQMPVSVNALNTGNAKAGTIYINY